MQAVPPLVDVAEESSLEHNSAGWRTVHMYAVVKTGGKQYRVSPGDSVEVEKLPYEVGQQIELDQVLLVANGAGAQIGQPLVDGAKVKATVTRQTKGRKLIVFKYRPSKRYRRKRGHRQNYTQLRIDEIIA
jgi:large subunit ribosomal protein L21